MANSTQEQSVRIPADSLVLKGILTIPAQCRMLVLFAHGSGSGRLSPRNQYVARVLNQAAIGTLLMDLLTEEEDAVYKTRFNIDLLTRRLLSVTQWARQQPATAQLSSGYFGASTGAAAALRAAATPGSPIRAVVSRGGRPDLAEDALPRVQAPTLLIIGGNDDIVLELNLQAYARLTAQKNIVVVPGATHLFEEPGTLEEVARLATQWFQQHLSQVFT